MKRSLVALAALASVFVSDLALAQSPAGVQALPRVTSTGTPISYGTAAEVKGAYALDDGRELVVRYFSESRITVTLGEQDAVSLHRRSSGHWVSRDGQVDAVFSATEPSGDVNTVRMWLPRTGTTVALAGHR